MIAANSTTGQRLAADYHAVTIAGAWYGPALADVLSELPVARASQSPIPGANTPAAVLQHLLLWNERTRRALAGDPMPPWDAPKDWSEAPIPWPELLLAWSRSRDQLEAALRAFPDARLSNTVPGREYTFATLLLGIVQHTIWHAGQLALLRSTSASLPPLP